MREIIPFVDVLIGNEEDASDVLGMHPRDVDIATGKLYFSSYKEVAQKAAEQFPRLKYVAFTLR